MKSRNLLIILQLFSLICFIFTLSYLAVPLYQIFCQQTGYGGTINIQTQQTPSNDNHSTHPLQINFVSQTDQQIPILFKENQPFVHIFTEEPVLAFYTSTNLSNQIITGVSTYNITPSSAAPYFHKIQCFCFDQQRWNPHETIELPILFYINQQILHDIQTSDIQNITISYTFFQVQ
jgi:cytochrome c oxidase assembly protein subunit 11